MIRKANEEAQQDPAGGQGNCRPAPSSNINKLAQSSGVDTKELEAERTKLREQLRQGR